MPTITTPNTSIELFYEEHGDPQAPALLLVMGLGAQMTLWPDELVAALAAEGFRVIRYDNRDIGLSQKFEGARAPSVPVQVLRKKIGFPAKVPYTLKDMADDGIGLLSALGIDKAHVVGASMGGMIVQLMAIHHPDRLLTMTSIMSTTGSAKLPQAEPAAIGALTAPLKGMDEETVVAHGLNIIRNIGTPDSPEFPFDEAHQRARVLANMRRSVYPAAFRGSSPRSSTTATARRGSAQCARRRWSSTARPTPWSNSLAARALPPRSRRKAGDDPRLGPRPAAEAGALSGKRDRGARARGVKGVSFRSADAGVRMAASDAGLKRCGRIT